MQDSKKAATMTAGRKRTSRIATSNRNGAAVTVATAFLCVIMNAMVITYSLVYLV